MNFRNFTIAALCVIGTSAFGAGAAKPAEGRRAAIDLIAQGKDLEEKGDKDGAARIYQQSIDLAPSPAGYYHLGHLYAQSGENDKARTNFESALKMNPSYELAKVELAGLDRTASVTKGKGRRTRTEEAESASSAMNVDELQRETETARSLKRPASISAINAAGGVGVTIPTPPSKLRSGFIPPAPQNPGAGDNPGIPLAAPRPTSPGTARRALEPEEPVMIQNVSDIKKISPQEKVGPRVAGARGVPVTYPPPEKTLTDPGAREQTQFSAAQDDLRKPRVARDGGAVAKDAAAGGNTIPTAEDINRVAFGPDSKTAANTVVYGNVSKVALGTFAFHKERGDNYRAAQRYRDAADEYKVALEMAPGDVETRTLLAEMLERSGQADEADTQFQRAEAIAPDDSRAFYRKGNIYRDQGKQDQAIGAYRQAIGIDPNDKFSHNNLGVVYMEKGDYNKAASEFKKVLDLDPNYDKAMLNLGIIYDDHLANKPEALKYYEMYLQHKGERAAEVQSWVQAIKAQM